MTIPLKITVLVRKVLARFIYYGLPAPFIEKEMYFLKRIIKPNDTVMDIGANIGIYTVYLSKIVGTNGHVYSLEPYGPTYNILKRMVEKLNLKNCKVINAAVGDSQSNVSLDLPLTKSGRVNDTYVHIKEDRNGQIQMTTVDEIVDKNSIAGLNFIKIDVEGYEFFVLKGAEMTIRVHKPVILIEIQDEWTKRYGKKKKEIFHLLQESYGYRPYVLDNENLIPAQVNDTLHNNFFFFPNDVKLDKLR